VVPGAALPPPGYDEIGAITITPARSILVQALSLLLAFATLAVLLAAAGAGSFTIGPTELVLLLVVIAEAIGVIFLHEAVHGLVFALSGRRPRFDAAIVHGMPVLSTSAVGPYGRNTGLICLLAPLVLIDAVLLGASAAVPTLFVWAIAPIVVNTAGSAGDLWLAAHLVRYSPAVLVADVPDGLVVYGRSDERRAAGR
jgi:hypothetical protein